MHFINHLCAPLLIVCLLLGFVPCVQAEDDPPNIILIFTDDQGYNDIGCFGSPKISTPHLDKMAAEGMKFTSFYSASSVCSPSRAALMTGCYPVRVGVPGVLFPGNKNGLNPDEITIADVLRSKGYATACIGKWHLGHKPSLLPTNNGFDYYYGIPYSNDMTIDPKADLADDVVLNSGMTLEKIRAFEMKGNNSSAPRNKVPLMRNDKVIEYPIDQSQLTQLYTKEAVRFITENKDRQFFLYLPHTMPHIPLFASEKFRGKSKRGLYGDTIEEIDWSVGQILKTVKELGLDENTLVVFTTDNGPWKLRDGRGGHADPLRGFKFQTYEGGMRVPCIMRFPGKIPAGKACDEIAATIDLLPTFSKLAGGDVPKDRIIDGHDIWPLMSGEQGASSPHNAYFYYAANRSNLQAVRSGKWKLRIDPKEGNQLFDLRADISESKNLAENHPDVVERLLKTMKEFDQELKANKRPAGKHEG